MVYYKMKKHIPIGACAILICVCLLGCGKQELEEPATSPDVRENTTVLNRERSLIVMVLC